MGREITRSVNQSVTGKFKLLLPNAENILLSFHSNFNAKFDPIELSHLLKPFGKALIHISLDAGTNIYSYFRTGNWEVLKENISFTF